MRKSFLIIFWLLIAVVICGALPICFNVARIKNSLFEFSIIDVLSFLTSVIIGFGLTYLISVSFSRESKTNEIIEESLVMIKEDFAHLMQYLMNGRNKKITESVRFHILFASKNTDKDISILKDMCEKKDFMHKPLKALLRARCDFNYIITGDNLIENQLICDSFIEKVSEQYYIIKQSIFQCKIGLYNPYYKF